MLERPQKLLTTLSSSTRGDLEAGKNRSNGIGGASVAVNITWARVMEGPLRLLATGEMRIEGPESVNNRSNSIGGVNECAKNRKCEGGNNSHNWGSPGGCETTV